MPFKDKDLQQLSQQIINRATTRYMPTKENLSGKLQQAVLRRQQRKPDGIKRY